MPTCRIRSKWLSGGGLILVGRSQSLTWCGLCLTPQGGRVPNNGPLLFSTHFPSASESPPLPLLGTFWLGVFYTSHCPLFPSLPRGVGGPGLASAGRVLAQESSGRPEAGWSSCKGSWAEELVTLQPPARTSLQPAVAEFLLAAQQPCCKAGLPLCRNRGGCRARQVWLAGTSLTVLGRKSFLDSAIWLMNGATVDPLGTRTLLSS